MHLLVSALAVGGSVPNMSLETGRAAWAEGEEGEEGRVYQMTYGTKIYPRLFGVFAIMTPTMISLQCCRRPPEDARSIFMFLKHDGSLKSWEIQAFQANPDR